MGAALYASDETVSCLLSWGVSPDKTNAYGHTALMGAITSQSVTTINLLAPVTQVNLGGALQHLAREKMDLMTGELRQLVERAAQDREVAIEGLEAAAKLGSSTMVEIIARNTKEHLIFAPNVFVSKEISPFLPGCP